MPDLRQTRRNIRNALGVLLAVDLAAVIVLFSPLIGSTNSRRQELNRLWAELQVKTRQVEPLRNLPQKVVLANRQITDFYKTRFPAQDSQIITEFGKLAAADGVTIDSAKYKANDVGPGHLQPHLLRQPDQHDHRPDRVGDRESVERRQEEEVVAERGHHGGQQ